VRPTRPGPLLGLVAGFAVLLYVLAETAYGSVPSLPAYAPVTLVLLAVTELGMAKVVADRLAHRRDGRGRPRGRPIHPMQVARAAVLAKASSVTGAVLLGAYGGLFAWTLPRRTELAVAERDALVAGLTALAALALVIAALVLERACRTPDDPDLRGDGVTGGPA
jgi:Protein of unknown function (DUF3180)